MNTLVPSGSSRRMLSTRRFPGGTEAACMGLLGFLLAAPAMPGCGSDPSTPEEDAANVAFPLLTDFPSTSQADATPLGGAFDVLTGQNESVVTLQVFAENGTLGHDHIIRATGFSGEITFSWADLSNCAIQVTLPVDGLAPDQDDMRKLAGLDGTLSKSDQESVKRNMTAADQLNQAKFGTITFQGSRCVASGQNGAGGHPVINVDGTLNLRGVSKSMTLPLEVATAGDTLAARGRVSFKHADFGFKAYNQVLFRNKEELYVQLDVRARRK
jgi:polyisoprenoid-binding protein YceI